MATNTYQAKALAAVASTPALVARKATLDEKFHAGTKAQRQALMAANGLRKARESKGYGRAAVANALGLTAAQWWVAEFVLVAGSPQCKAMAALVASLPQATKAPTGALASKPTPSKGKGTPAPAATPSSGPATTPGAAAKPTASNADVAANLL